MSEPKRTWADIDLAALLSNYRALRARAGEGVKFLGVVKANAYGHGAVPVAKLLEEAGADYLAVACLEEGATLREAGVIMPILILGLTEPRYTPELLRYDLTAAVGSRTCAEEMSRMASEAKKRVRIHLKIDTGMGRVGFTCREDRDPLSEILPVMDLPGLDIEGIFTHFATSDMPGIGDDYQKMQYRLFTGLTARLEEAVGRRFSIRHCANSGAVTGHPDTFLDMVRPGIALYGCYPSELRESVGLTPVMSVRTRIAQIRDFREGDSVSYGRIYTAPGPRRIAVVPVGYADGLHRVLSGKIDMLVHGQRVPQVGRICMDMCMLDVTDVPDAEEGDLVTLFGKDGEACIPVEEQAEKAGTISYEILSGIAPRVERVYRMPQNIKKILNN